jgi:predicted HTH domain antitoxin
VIGCGPMNILNINVPISEEVLFILKKDEKSLQKEITSILALQFFKEKRLSLGKSAELAGMTKNEFVEFLGKHEIAIYQYTEKELTHEADFIKNLTDGNSQ